MAKLFDFKELFLITDTMDRKQKTFLADGQIATVANSLSKIAAIPEIILNKKEFKFEYDKDKGWPPQIKNFKTINSKTINLIKPGYLPTLDRMREQEIMKNLLCNCKIKELLKGRWEHLGTHLLSLKNQFDCDRDLLNVRVCFCNYTANHLVEVYLRGNEILEINQQPNHCHPEAAIEILQSISLVFRHKEYEEKVKGLHAQAILQMPQNPNHPNYGHRVLFVMFTEKDNNKEELPLMYSALVDLNTQEVIHFGEAQCIQKKVKPNKQ